MFLDKLIDTLAITALIFGVIAALAYFGVLVSEVAVLIQSF
jgi:hypothetical protein